MTLMQSSGKVFIGIDSGATTSKVAAVRGDGSFVSMELLQRSTNSSAGPSGVIEAWMNLIAEFLGQHQIHWDQVGGVGLAVPGPRRSYGILDLSPNMPASFAGWNVEEDLGNALLKASGRSLPLSLGNDGNFGGVAEAAQARAGGKGAVVMLAPGSGLGGAFVDGNGLPLDGDTLAGMEVGHMPAPLHLLDVKPYPCGCGRTWGCYEVYTSLAGLPYLLEDALKRYPDHPLATATGTPKEKALSLRGLAQKNDALALELFDLQAKAMGLLVANLAMAVDPDAYVIGGGLMDPHATTDSFRARYLGILTETARTYLWPTQKQRLRVVPASLGELSQAIGAALVALYRA